MASHGRKRPDVAKRSASADTEGVELDARRAARTRAAELLRAGRTPLAVIAAADSAVAAADAGLNAVRKSHAQPRSDCREGCDWCCYLTVGTAAPEVLRIVAHLREALPPEEFQALRERAARLSGARRERAASGPLPCALLVEHRCAAYAVRPLTCRGFNSGDARRCQRSLADRTVTVPADAAQVRLHTFALDGLRAGLAEAGLPGDLLELTAALHVALETPDAAARWLAGEAIFAPARLP